MKKLVLSSVVVVSIAAASVVLADSYVWSDVDDMLMPSADNCYAMGTEASEKGMSKAGQVFGAASATDLLPLNYTPENGGEIENLIAGAIASTLVDSDCDYGV